MSNVAHRYNTTLQGLRGLAILLIVLSHCRYSSILNEFNNSIFMWAGALGVQLFIFLSGYLLLYNFEKSKIIPEFFTTVKKKLVKFYPLHFITLIFALPFVYRNILNPDFEFVQKLLLNLFLLQSYIPDMNIYYAFNIPDWYLSTNFFFIILAPFFIKIIKFTAQRGNVNFFIVLIVVSEYILFYLFKDSTIAHWILYICPIVRSLDFVVGGYMYVSSKEKETVNKIGSKCIIFAILCNLSLLYLSAHSNNWFYLTAAWIIPNIALFAGIINNNFNYIKTKFFNNKFLVFIGNISFEIFLIHFLVFKYFTYYSKKIGLDDTIWVYILSFSLTVLISVIYKNGEKKFLDSFFYKV